MIGLSQQSLGVGPGRVGAIVDFEMIVSEAMFYVWKKASRASLRGEYFLDRRRNTEGMVWSRGSLKRVFGCILIERCSVS